MNKILRYYSLPNKQGIRVSVFGIERDDSLEIAVARCSAEDNFTKKKARWIAEGRLAKGKLYKTIPLKNLENFGIKDFISIAESIAIKVGNTKYPHKSNQPKYN